MCAQFRKIETFGTLRGKHSARNAFSFVYSDPSKAIISEQFDISEDRIPKLKEISKELLESLRKQGLSKDEILATFAECCEQTIVKEGL
jgi:DNA-binding transcriptional regulator YhcF (GntR family)